MSEKQSAHTEHPPRFERAEERAARILAACADKPDLLREAIAREIRSAVKAATQDAEEIEKLRTSERHYRVFAEQSSDVFWICDLEMNFTYVSPSVERMRGFTPEEVKKQRMDQIFTPASAQLLVNTLKQGLVDEAMGRLGPHLWRVLELEQICKDGSTLWTEAAATWLKDEQGNVVGILGVTRNIDARKRAEEALRRAHEELEQRVLDRTAELREALKALRKSEERATVQYKGVPIPTYTWQWRDEDFVLIDWNDAAVAATAGRIAEWNGISAGKHFEARPDICEDLKRCREERRTLNREMEYHFGAVDETRWVDVTYGFIPPDLVLLHVSDITERKQAEERERRHQEELRQADKLAALGGLVSGVAHEINNPNHVISLNASTVQSLLPDLVKHLDQYEKEKGDLHIGRLPWNAVRAEAPRLIEDIRTATNRIKRIVTDLKEYARPDHIEPPMRFNVNEAVEGAITLMRTVLRKATHQFEHELANELPSLMGRKQRIEQVVINLLQNACQALPDAEHAVRIRTYRMPDRDDVVIEVQDEGVGISSQHLSRLTDPFFTTKREQGGTGLGLAVSLGIAREHGGDLEFLSKKDRGTTVRLVLPITGNGNTEPQ